MWSTSKPSSVRLVAGVALAAAVAMGQPATAQSGICPLTGLPPIPVAAPCNLQLIEPSTNAPDTGRINPDT